MLSIQVEFQDVDTITWSVKYDNREIANFIFPFILDHEINELIEGKDCVFDFVSFQNKELTIDLDECTFSFTYDQCLQALIESKNLLYGTPNKRKTICRKDQGEEWSENDEEEGEENDDEEQKEEQKEDEEQKADWLPHEDDDEEKLLMKINGLRSMIEKEKGKGKHQNKWLIKTLEIMLESMVILIKKKQLKN